MSEPSKPLSSRPTPLAAGQAIYRRVNLLSSMMIAGSLVLLLIVAVVSILLYGQIRRVHNDLGRKIDDLSARLAAAPMRARPASQPGRLAPSARPGPANPTPPASPAAAEPSAPPPPPPYETAAADSASATRGDGGYNVSPTAGLPTVDPNRPPGVPGWFHDLKTGAVPDDDNPMLLLITGPKTVKAALDEIAKLTVADALRSKITPEQRLLAGQLFLQTNEPEQAHRWAGELANDQPANGRAWLFAGLASLKLKQFPQAIDELTRAAAKLPDRPEPFKALGEAQLAAGQIDPAVEAYRKAVAANPKDLEIATRLADLLLLTKPPQIDQAVAVLQANLKEDPKRSWDRARLAKLLVTQDKANDALAVLDATPDDAPEDVRMLLARGHALMATNNLKLPEAEAAFEKAVEMNRLSAEGWHFLGLARLKQRKNAPAVTAFETAIAIDSTLPASWEYLGVALANDNRLNEAVAKLQEAVRLNVASAQAQYLLALLLTQQKQFDAALDSLKKAIKLDATLLARAKNEKLFTDLPADNVLAKFLKEPANP